MVGNGGYTFYWGEGEETTFSLPATQYSSGLTSTRLDDVVLVIPRKGKDKIRIVAYDQQLVDAGGY